MQVIIWTGGDEFELANVDEPRIGAGQIMVKVEAAAICGTDFHYADFGSKPPIIPGHEVAGIVDEIARGVEGFDPGQRVALDPVQRCGTCYSCTHDIGHLCLNVRHLGGEKAPGGWAEYVCVDASNAYTLPDEVNTMAGALSEPAAVCRQSFHRAGMRPGARILIIGDGPFGFLHAMIGRALGARSIIHAGHYDERLDRIADFTGAIPCNTHRADVQELVDRETDSLGVDIAIDASGAGCAPNIGIGALRPRGSLVIFSLIWNPEPLDMVPISLKELNVVGSCRSLNCFAECIDMMAKGTIAAERIIDVEAPLSEYKSAMKALKERKAEVFKAVLRP